jgi:hypothetical protein
MYVIGIYRMKDSVADCAAIHFRQDGGLGYEAVKNLRSGIFTDPHCHKKTFRGTTIINQRLQWGFPIVSWFPI